MNVVCTICTELYKIKTEDIVTTTCGHVFHRNCLENWLVRCEVVQFYCEYFYCYYFVSSYLHCSNLTCPSCRKEPTTSRSLIKLYFELDEAKGVFNLDDILKANEQIIKELKKEKEKHVTMEIKFKEMELKLTESTDRTKFLERQKQLDDMAIAGLKSIKEDSTKEILKLSGSIKNLRLDYLAEKQLRRIHQQSLHNLDPDNENYNTDVIQSEEPKQNMITNGELPFTQSNFSFIMKNFFDDKSLESSPGNKIASPWNLLDCEAKPAEKDAGKPNSAYIVPNKIQKASKDPRLHKSPNRFSFTKKTAENKKADPVIAYNFRPNSSSSPASTSNPQPSTSAGVKNLNLNKTRTFGKDKPFFDLSIPSESPTNNTSAFNFPQTPTSIQSSLKEFEALNLTYRSTNLTSMFPKSPTSAQRFSFSASPFTHSRNSPFDQLGQNVGTSTKLDNEVGPKMSDR